MTERRQHPWWWGLLAAALVPLAVVLLWIGWPLGLGERVSETGETRPVTVAKGAPAAAVYIKRGERVFLWDGQQPVRPGDRLRLEVAGAGYTRVSVFTPRPGTQLHRSLYVGVIELEGSSLLPKAWQVDDAPGDEELLVVFSHQPISEARVTDVVRAPFDPPRAWAVRFVLPKRLSDSKTP